MSTVRRTVTLPEHLAAAVDAAVVAGAAPSASALLSEAAGAFLAHLGNDRLAAMAQLLDETTERRIIQRVRDGVPQGWERLSGAR